MLEITFSGTTFTLKLLRATKLYQSYNKSNFITFNFYFLCKNKNNNPAEIGLNEYLTCQMYRY